MFNISAVYIYLFSISSLTEHNGSLIGFEEVNYDDLRFTLLKKLALE